MNFLIFNTHTYAIIVPYIIIIINKLILTSLTLLRKVNVYFFNTLKFLNIKFTFIAIYCKYLVCIVSIIVAL